MEEENDGLLLLLFTITIMQMIYFRRPMILNWVI